MEAKLSSVASAVINLANGVLEKSGADWTVELGAYELKSFALPPEAEVLSFDCILPVGAFDAARLAAEKVLAAITAARSAKSFIPGMEPLAADMIAALADKRTAWLRRASTSYIARKCLKLAEEKSR